MNLEDILTSLNIPYRHIKEDDLYIIEYEDKIGDVTLTGGIYIKPFNSIIYFLSILDNLPNNEVALKLLKYNLSMHGMAYALMPNNAVSILAVKLQPVISKSTIKHVIEGIKYGTALYFKETKPKLGINPNLIKPRYRPNTSDKYLEKLMNILDTLNVNYERENNTLEIVFKTFIHGFPYNLRISIKPVNGYIQFLSRMGIIIDSRMYRKLLELNFKNKGVYYAVDEENAFYQIASIEENEINSDFIKLILDGFIKGASNII